MRFPRSWTSAVAWVASTSAASPGRPLRTSSRSPIRRPTRARFRQRCDRPRPLRRRASHVRSGTRRQECLNRTGIRGYPPRYAPRRANPPANKIPANPPVWAKNLANASLDRTQEVGGSSPPSSISRTPAVERRMARRAWRGLSAKRPGVKQESSISVSIGSGPAFFSSACVRAALGPARALADWSAVLDGRWPRSESCIGPRMARRCVPRAANCPSTSTSSACSATCAVAGIERWAPATYRATHGVTADEYHELAGLRPRHPLWAPDLIEAHSERLHARLVAEPRLRAAMAKGHALARRGELQREATSRLAQRATSLEREHQLAAAGARLGYGRAAAFRRRRELRALARLRRPGRLLPAPLRRRAPPARRARRRARLRRECRARRPSAARARSRPDAFTRRALGRRSLSFERPAPPSRWLPCAASGWCARRAR